MRRTTAMLFTGLVVLAAGRPAAADQSPEPLSRKAVDEAVYSATRKALAEGADLYNTGYPVASAYLFRGTLLGIEPLLDDRPDLKRAVRRGLDDAQRQASIDDRAWTLHYVTIRVWMDVKPAVAILDKDTLWGRLGGERGVKAIVDNWINDALRDDRVNLSRGGQFLSTPAQIDRFKDQLVHLTSAVGGGPLQYTGRFMKPAHAGMGITGVEFDAFVSHLKMVLPRHKVDAKDVQIILGAIATIRADIVGGSAAAGGVAAAATLWDRLGGEQGATAIVNDWIDSALNDAQVNLGRNGRFFQNNPDAVKALKRQIVILASAVGGGPFKYEGRPLNQIHARLGITGAEFDAFVSHLNLALNKHNVAPADIALILKAIRIKRNDVVAPKGGAMPGPAAGGAGTQGNAGGVPPAAPGPGQPPAQSAAADLFGLVIWLLGGSSPPANPAKPVVAPGRP